MRILNVNMSLDPVTGGGGAERTFQLSRSLVKSGIECTVLTTDLGLTAERIKALDGVKVVALPCLLKRFYIPKFSYKKIKNIVKDADVVHLMGHWTFINALVYSIAHCLNKPYVVCPAGTLPIYGRSRIIKKIYNYVIGSKIIRNANGHIAIAVNEIDQFQTYGVEAGKTSIIPNGINVEDFQTANIADFRRKYGFGDAPFMLFVGRLNSIKGPDLLLRAFCNVKDKFSNYHLVFVGPDGGMLSELKDMVVESSASDRVHFLGYLGGADKSQAYHAADVLIIPSRQEAMSIVALEAGITGTPVLLTDQCGFDDIGAIDGGDVVPATVDGISRGLIENLKDPVKLKLKGENLKKYTLENFTWDSVICKYMTLFHQIFDETGRASQEFRDRIRK
ncbi:MAG: glycosyltransferase [Proteobacteria bacterium]|nr:glycosyltransferase [Pseudomonadota bacterium]